MITQIQKDILNEFAQVKLEEKLITQKVDELKVRVLQIMQDNSVEEIELKSYGKINVASKRTYKYTEETQQKETELKQIKKEEEQRGEAQYTESNYVVFKALK